MTDLAMARAWMMESRSRRCVLCGARRPHGHHVLAQQHVRKACASLGLDYETYRWDQRNLLALCEAHHVKHHARMKAISLAIVCSYCPEIIPFAQELGLEWRLSREYPVRGGERGAPWERLSEGT